MPNDGDNQNGNGSGSGDGNQGDPGDGLGPAGEKALREERKARKDAEKRAAEHEAELKKLREATATESEKALQAAVDAAKKEVRDEYEAKIAARDRRDAISKAAAGKLANPEDAALFLSDVDSLDPKDVEKAITDLLKDRPYLAARRTNGSAEGGGRGDTQENAGAGTQSEGSNAAMNDLIRQAAGRGSS
jgi:membrane protein involved in colicin uptake